jgi:hypothetical protein
MIYRLAADLVLLAHFAFIILVVGGGLIVLRYSWFVWIHIPAACWGAFVELKGYDVSFIEQYVLPVIYPAGLTRNIQLILAGIVIAINAIIYTAILLRKKKLP